MIPESARIRIRISLDPNPELLRSGSVIIRIGIPPGSKSGSAQIRICPNPDLDLPGSESGSADLNLDLPASIQFPIIGNLCCTGTDIYLPSTGTVLVTYACRKVGNICHLKKKLQIQLYPSTFFTFELCYFLVNCS